MAWAGEHVMLFEEEIRSGWPQLSMGEIAERVEAADPLIRVGYFFRDIPDTVIVRIMSRTDPATDRPYSLE